GGVLGELTRCVHARPRIAEQPAASPSLHCRPMLDGERYLSLATFRRDGRAVETPIWFAGDARALYAFSAGDAGKIKRLRNSPRAGIAACDARGRVHGDWSDARAYLVTDPAQRAHADELLHAKYGWMMWLADTGSRLTGRHAKRAYLRIEPVGS